MRYLIMLLVALYGCAEATPGTEEVSVIRPTAGAHDDLIVPEEPGLNTGMVPPEFMVTDTEGNVLSLDTYKGKPVIVYFMATWCPYCKLDFESLAEVHDEFDVDLVVVSLDLKEDAEKLATYKAQFLELSNIPFAEGNEDILRKYQVTHTTTKYAIDRNGRIVYRGSGAFSEQQWTTLLSALA